MNTKGVGVVGLKRGFNKPQNEGIYICENDFVWEFKVFHEYIDEPTYLIAREFNTDESLGPLTLDNHTPEKIAEALESKSNQLCDKLAGNAE